MIGFADIEFTRKVEICLNKWNVAAMEISAGYFGGYGNPPYGIAGGVVLWGRFLLVRVITADMEIRPTGLKWGWKLKGMGGWKDEV